MTDAIQLAKVFRSHIGDLRNKCDIAQHTIESMGKGIRYARLPWQYPECYSNNMTVVLDSFSKILERATELHGMSLIMLLIDQRFESIQRKLVHFKQVIGAACHEARLHTTHGYEEKFQYSAQNLSALIVELEREMLNLNKN